MLTRRSYRDKDPVKIVHRSNKLASLLENLINVLLDARYCTCNFQGLLRFKSSLNVLNEGVFFDFPYEIERYLESLFVTLAVLLLLTRFRICTGQKRLLQRIVVATVHRSVVDSWFWTA